MLKFRPSNLTQKRVDISFNKLQLIALIEKGLSDNSLRGFLYKRSSPDAKWRMKWFLLFENLLFYFDVGSSEQQQHQSATTCQAQNQQQQQQLLLQLPQSGGPKTPRRTGSALSSLIRRKQPKGKGPVNQDGGDLLKEPRRASADDRTLATDTLPASQHEANDERAGPNPDTNRHSLTGAGRRQVRVSESGSGNGPSQQQRLGSDPQPGGALSTGDLTSLNSGYESSTAFALGGGGGCRSHSSAGKSKTQNSSSISGVSGHFLAHNEQTIGRFTTTTAGKTATSSANYSSLLNRKIGVLFLEGSYCERLVDSGANFTGHVNSMAPSGSRPGSFLSRGSVAGSSSNVLEMEASRHYNEFASSVGNINHKSSNSLTNSICNINNNGGAHSEDSGFNCVFTLKWRKEGSKEYQFRSETEPECHTWVHAISNARYSTLLNDKEQLEQKYLHLSQIIESESTAKWQYSKQCEEFLAEIKKLRQEICLLKRQESRSNQLKLVLGKSAAIIETIMRQQGSRQQNKQQPQQGHYEEQQPLQQHPQSDPQTGAQATNNKITSTSSTGKQHHEQAAAAASTYLGQLGAASSVRSMDQEQEDHEVALRRIRRNTNLLRLASLDPQHHPLRCTSSLGAGGGTKQRVAPMSASQPPLKSLARSATRPALPVAGGQSRALSALSSVPFAGGQTAPTPRDCRLRTSGGAPKASSPSPSSCSAPATNELASGQQHASSLAAGHDKGGREDAAGDHDGLLGMDKRALTSELNSIVEALNNGILLPDCLFEAENSEEIRKIKKVQGFFRGWLCRRRWKQIVQEYIKSPHAESMRKRNNLVFRMVECEEEYVEQLTLLISAFLRPIKMTASSQRPALNHDELNSIFLNSETLLFLHQIFLKGLTARMESWPTLILGDLFNMLLPMLTIYQEYVRNHHFSLQVLAECKQRDQFSSILRRLEEKPQLNGRTLETFLTYPMHQIPRYIICLHEILAHTPHNHVERKGLYEAQTKLEDLSRQMHDEVSETENIRQNLAIERMINGGCDILLDVNQVFVRQGILLQAVEQQAKAGKGRYKLASFTSRQSNKQNHHHQQQCQQLAPFSQSDFNAQFGQITNSGSQHATPSCDNSHQTTKDLIRQCFLFTNHLLLCTRTKDGKLHLLENFGRISLSEVTLIENPLEFVQQQETIIANFESIQQNHHHHHQPPATPTTNHQRLETDSNSANIDQPSNCTHGSDGATHRQHTALGDKKQASTTNSAPTSQWAASQSQCPHERSDRKAKDQRGSHVEFELANGHRVGSVCSQVSSSSVGGPIQLSSLAQSGRHRRQSQQHQTTERYQYPLSSVAPSSCFTDDSANSSPSKQSTGSSRRRLAGYLATKLSNLTNLGGGGSNQQLLHLGASSSAPPSPLNRPTPQTTNAGQSQQQQQQYGYCVSNSRRVNSGSVSGPGGGGTVKHMGTNNCYGSQQSPFYLPKDYGGCDFILIIESTSNLSGSNSSSQANTNSGAAGSSGGSGGGSSGHPIVIHLVAPNLQEKAAWMSDISQCIDNVHFNDLFHGSVNDSSSVTINQSVRTDPRLYKDDVDIKFSRALNSCKLPQIRYASKERLFERLTDLRFLSIDFLNTFLLTYRVFTNAEDVIEALKSVHYNCERYYQQQQQQHQQHHQQQQQLQHHHHLQQQLGQSIARDSFSVFPNTSLNSLNTNNTSTLVSDQAIEELNDQKAPQVLSKSPQALINCDDNNNKSPTNNPIKSNVITQQADPHQHTQKPSIPPRSSGGVEAPPGNKLSVHQLDQQPIQKNNKYLMAPSANQTQKRRSTISALTPITGSNSSSLANLSTMYNKSGASEQTSHNNLTALTAPGGSSCPTGSLASSLGGRTSESHSCGSNNLEDLLALRLSEDESDILSPPIDPAGSSNSCDRLRSSSITQGSRGGPRGEDTINSFRMNLDVPGCRQVRASSLSHVTDARLMGSNLPADRVSGAGGGGGGNTEHWRLSYQKATEMKGAGGKKMETMLHLGPGPMATRRASSSDVTFHVTLDPPQPPKADPAEPHETQDTAIELVPAPEEDKFSSSVPSPIVPPSTPIETISPMPDETTNEDDRGAMLLDIHGYSRAGTRLSRSEAAKKRKGSKEGRSGKCRRPVDRSDLSSSDSSLAAAASSSSSLSYVDTKSVISSQSESELIQSTSSASLDSSASNVSHEPMITASDGAGFEKLMATRRPPNGRDSHHHRHGHTKHGSSRFKADHEQRLVKDLATRISNEMSRAQIKRQQEPKQERLLVAQKLIIKEIDLNEAKILDCDTSADEDKISTSSGSERDELDDEMDKTEGDDDDDRSVLILSRLNSVRLYDKSTSKNRRTDPQGEEPSESSELESAPIGKKNTNTPRQVKPTKGSTGSNPSNLSSKCLNVPHQHSNKSKQSDSNLATSTESVNLPSDHQETVDRGALATSGGRLFEPKSPASQSIDQSERSKAVFKDPSGISQKNLEAPSSSPLTQQPTTDEATSQQSSRADFHTATTQTPDPPSSAASGQTVIGLNSTTSASSRMTTPRSSFQQQHNAAETSSCDRISKAGVIVSSSTPRVSSRRSSTASAASAFAAATAASNNPILTQPPPSMKQQQHQPNYGGHRSTGERINFDYNNLIDCLCSNFHRASVSSCQSQQMNAPRSIMMQPRPCDLSTNRSLQQHQQHQQFLHYPSCIYYNQQQQQVSASPSNTPSNSYPNAHSDASSMCNSRASSRLSSCAGLEYSSYSSAPTNNLYSISQQHQTMARGGSGAINQAGGQAPSRQVGGAHSNEQSIADQMIQASKHQNNPRSSKRHSTQINVRSVATIRVLSVLRHWVSKHSQDFINDTKLSYLVQEFLQDLIMDNNLLPAEHKAALQLQQMVQKAAHSRGSQVDFDLLLAAPARPSSDSIETLSALEIAEGMTYLDHKIFLAIRSEEFLGQAWMKMDKAMKAPHILLITKRFNDVSRLVSSEIIRVPELHRRVAIIEKWTNVAHICRVVHNFNGVLQICAAFTNSAVFRLKKTWDKIPKTTKTTIDQLQNLVSTDSRFRNMRDAINRCDPPSIPYVGMYLTDLSFIEEGTPNYSPDGLLNFSKMRMIAHVIREIQHLQNGCYKIELNHRVANYLLDASRHLQDDEMYKCSLAIEPRSSGGKNGVQILNSVSGQYNSTNQQQQQQQSQPQQQQPQQQPQPSTTNLQVKNSNSGKN